MIHVRAEVFGVLTLIPWALNMLAVRERRTGCDPALSLTVMIMSLWVVTTTLERTFSPPGSYYGHWALDLVALGACAWTARVKGVRFAAVLAWLYAFQICASAAYLLRAWVAPGMAEGASHYVFKSVLNALFLAQLVAVGWPGGRHALRRFGASWRSYRRQNPELDA